MKTSNSATHTLPPARQRILQAAHDLFYREGIRATGIDKVIACAGVTKVTFYRHFPSKHDLILAFLELRHHEWMAWFKDSIQRHGGDLKAIVSAMKEWFHMPTFRGCAFLNSVSEIGGELPEVLVLTQQHKDELVEFIAGLLPGLQSGRQHALAISVAMDGAIQRALFDPAPDQAELALQAVVESFS